MSTHSHPGSYADIGLAIVIRHTVTGDLIVADDKYELEALMNAAGWADADTEDITDDAGIQAQLGQLYDTNEIAYSELVTAPFNRDRLARDLAEPTQETLLVGLTPQPDGTPVTSQEVDRLLGLADQFLEDWEDGVRKDFENDTDVVERRKEWAAVRPLLVAAPELLACLNELLDWGRRHTSPTDPYSPHDLLVKANNLISALKKHE